MLIYGWSNLVPERFYPSCDFEARIRIFSSAEGGRRSAVFNGVRWDFAYAERRPADTLYMIWPDFLDEAGNPRSDDDALPPGEELAARMTIAVDEMRQQVHRARIAPGVRFFCHEGGKLVAEGVVTRVTGLFDRSDALRKPPLPPGEGGPRRAEGERRGG